MITFFRDLRHAFRSLLRSPGFTLVAALTLALGIGATTAIFIVLNTVVLDPLPYPESERLVYLDSPVSGLEVDWRWGLSQAGYFHFRENNRSFDEIGVFGSRGVNLTGDGQPERATGAWASAGLLRVLGAQPALGRSITESDDVPGAAAIAVLSHDFWVARYGADPGIIGSTIRIDGEPREVVGVLAPGIELPEQDVDLWVPMGLDPSAPAQNSHFLSAIARLKPGVELSQAQADLNRMTAQFPELFPQAYSPGWMAESKFRTDAQPLREKVVGEVTGRLWILLGAVGLVLLIACANVANLFLVRTEGRQREVTIRAALGASRGRLASHFLAESFIVVLFAGALGLFLAYAGVQALISLAPESLPRLDEVAVGSTAVGFAAALSILAGLVIGSFPLLRFGTRLSKGLLTETGRGMTSGRERNAARNLLVIGQVAMALVLLASAGLMLQSFRRLHSVDPGFDPRGVLTFQLNLSGAEYQSAEQVASFHQQLIGRLEALPMVRTAGMMAGLPLEGWGGCSATVVEGRPDLTGDLLPCLPGAPVAPGFFRTMGIRMEAGREFEPRDNEQRTGSIIISRALAERLWPGEDPIGKGLGPMGYGPPENQLYRVIGVASDVRGEGLDQPPSEMTYLPLLRIKGQGGWSPPRSMHVVVRTNVDQPTAITGEVRRVLAEMDPNVPIANVRAMEEVVGQSLVRTSLTMFLLGIAATVALLLGAVGLYGVLSYVVGQRQNEIGIRMALGARMEQVAGLVMRQSLRLALAGVAVGLVAALAVTRALRSLLFEVSPTDPVTLAVVSLLLIVVALVASYLPARRAARVDPMLALRAE
jgi:putative ABC transport system permease protein